ncbi:MAG: phosphatase PAP2 family protein [Candidatus Promineifilaceae bacterium]|jgi:membrane-associated phospholipid phosphatase
MNSPRDWHVHDRTGLTLAARLFSNIVSPPVIFAVMGLVLSLYSLPFAQALSWAVIYGLFVSLMPILLVLWLLSTGRVEELHMSNTRERNLPYIVAVLSSIVFLIIANLADGPPLLRCLGIFNVIALTALAIINTRWLISFHATAVAAAWTITGLVFGWQASLWVLPLVALVVAVRLYLRRHTISQVIAGLALGVASVWVLTLIGCFG